MPTGLEWINSQYSSLFPNSVIFQLLKHCPALHITFYCGTRTMIMWLWMSFLKTVISLCWPMFYSLQVNETDDIIQDFCINQKDSTWWFWAKTGRWKERGIEWETWVCIRRLKDYVHFQRYNLHAFCVDLYRDPWPRICAVLDWDSILCHVSNRYDWKFLAFDYHHIRTQPPSAHVYFPRHG